MGKGEIGKEGGIGRCAGLGWVWNVRLFIRSVVHSLRVWMMRREDGGEEECEKEEEGEEEEEGEGERDCSFVC